MPDRAGDAPSSTALRTDRYELTMLDAARADGTIDRPCTFEVFARRLPAGRRFGVFAGLGRLLERLAAFRFALDEQSWLAAEQIVGPDTLAWLADWRFSGHVHAYREGEPFFPGSPVLTVTAPFGQAVVLETLLLSVLNHDSAVASAAARMVAAAGDRPLTEFGSRRTHEDAAVAAARATHVAGFASTSNLEAGRRFGVPTSGTVAHAFLLLHDDETKAFVSQLRTAGEATTLLVDTHDVDDGVRHAIDAVQRAGLRGLDAIRIDSGDLAAHARDARRQLDAAGLTDTRIVVSGDLDEHAIARLAHAPIDGYGVGTSVVTGSGAPTAEFVYKLVARAGDDGRWRDVAKAGGVKATIGGRKHAWRQLHAGVATTELLRTHTDTGPPTDARALQVPVIDRGEVVHEPSLDDIRAHHRRAMAELPAGALDLHDGEPAIPTRYDIPAEPSPPGATRER
ncbi:MAG: nicotinate phosphoribosyltransferase [Nitriliruptoraceae bacterium]